jgi:hypothetical protein
MTMLAHLRLLDILLQMNHSTISVIGQADDNPADPDSPGSAIILQHLIDPDWSRLSKLRIFAGAAR